MKSLFFAILLTAQCHAALFYIPDSAKLKEAADVMVLARFTEIKETGLKKQLDAWGGNPDNSALFRQFTVTARPVTPIKGEVPDTFKLTLYRKPTYAECIEDFGRDEGSKRFSAMGRNDGYAHVFSKLPTGHIEFLCYLKKSDDGSLSPAMGDALLAHSVFQVVPSHLGSP